MKTIVNVNRPPDYTITFPNPPGGSASMLYPREPVISDFDVEPNTVESYRTPVVKRSFNAIKKAGVISMTPFEVVSRETKNFVGQVPESYVIIRRPHAWTGGVCVMDPGQIDLVTSWTKQGDFRHWSWMYQHQIGFHRYLNALPDISSAVRSTQSAAVAAFKSGYDLLTELAEGRETLAFFASTSRSASSVLSKLISDVEPEVLRRALKGNLSPKKLLKSSDRALRSLGSKWMAYRYAIMPLFYSYKDIKELIEKRGLLFKSFRQKEKFEIEHPGIPSGALDLCLLSYFYGSIEVRSTVKAGYSKEGLQSFVSSSMGFNPLATAYELIPLSFVFDWIVNMGDFIVSHTSLDFSEQSAMCTSIREKFTEESVIAVDQLVTVTQNTGGAGDPCIPTPIVMSKQLAAYSVEVVRQRTHDNYKRFLFTAADVKLSLQSSMMNWKRYVDSAVLSHQSLKNLLKRISK